HGIPPPHRALPHGVAKGSRSWFHHPPHWLRGIPDVSRGDGEWTNTSSGHHTPFVYRFVRLDRVFFHNDCHRLLPVCIWRLSGAGNRTSWLIAEGHDPGCLAGANV